MKNICQRKARRRKRPRWRQRGRQRWRGMRSWTLQKLVTLTWSKLLRQLQSLRMMKHKQHMQGSLRCHGRTLMAYSMKSVMQHKMRSWKCWHRNIWQRERRQMTKIWNSKSVCKRMIFFYLCKLRMIWQKTSLRIWKNWWRNIIQRRRKTQLVIWQMMSCHLRTR